MIVNKRILAIGLLLTLAITLVAPATAEDISKPATVSVTIPDYINFTITDYGDAGINFGVLNPGMLNRPDLAQNGANSALRLVVGAETNVPCDVDLMGDGDFSDGGSNVIGLGQATWSGTNSYTGAPSMTMSYASVGTTVAGALHNFDIWHWITIPSDAVAGDYSTTFSYRAQKQ